jgi:hypothetical protein
MIPKVILPVFLAAVALQSSGQEAANQEAARPQAPVVSGSDFFNQAPPGVEDGLRARLKLFYDAYLTGKFRGAYEMVAEEDKDDYFNRAKTPYHSYRFGSIQFSDNFSKAKVMLVVNRDFHFQGHTMAVDVPIAEDWKIESGQWVWYLPNKGVRETPFGIAAPVPPASSAPEGSKPPMNMPTDPQSMTAAFNRIAWPDKPVLTLGPASQFQDHTELTNRSEKLLTFHLEFKPLLGLKVEPQTGQIAPGHSLTIYARYESPNQTLPIDRSARPIQIIYDAGGKVQVEVVWEKDMDPKSAAAKIH